MSSTVFLMLACLCVTVTARTRYQAEMELFYLVAEAYEHNNMSTSGMVPSTGDTMLISVDVGLLALQEFDEVAGTVELMVLLKMSWTDPILNITEKDVTAMFVDPFTASVKSLVFPRSTIWTPALVIYNSVDVEADITSNSYKPRYNFGRATIPVTTDTVQWNPKTKVKSTCSVDVTYYPFDKQECTVTLMAWEYTSAELMFELATSSLDVSKYSDNGEWALERTKLWSEVVDSTSRLSFSVTIRRRPLYYTFNIVAPILVLVVLNCFVFWLPVESGERVGFSVTCFLSFMVVLNMVMDFMPRSSDPMSVLCFYVVCMMIFSGAQTATVVLEMRLFHKPEKEKVPRCVQWLILFFQCKKCKRDDQKVDDVSVSPKVSVHPGDQKRAKDKGKDSKAGLAFATNAKEVQHAVVAFGTDEKDEEVTWAEATRFMDNFLFICFIGGELFFTLVYLSPLLAQAA